MIDVSLKGKVVVVTGAGGRLGRHIVNQFASHGATMAAVVRNEQQARDIPFPENGEGWAFPADVTNEKMVQTIFRQIADQFKRIDVLIHAVGMWEAFPFEQTSLESWDHVMQVNLKSAFLCFREAVPLMQKGGRLIAFASRQGADRGTHSHGAYSAAKAGIIRLVESVADEYRGTGITAHAIAPSTILFDDSSNGPGVPVEHITAQCLFLSTSVADSLSGAVIRMYG